MAASVTAHALLLGAFLISWSPRDLPEKGGETAIAVEFIVVAPDSEDHAAASAAPAQVVVDLPEAPETAHIPLPTVVVALPKEPPALALAAIPVPPSPPAEPVPAVEPPPESEAEIIRPAKAAQPQPRPQPDPSVARRERERQATLAEERAERRREEAAQAARQREARQQQASRAEAARQRATAALPAAPGNGPSSQSSRAAQRGGATGGAAASAGAADIASYRARVLAHLARFKQYPDAAQEREITGRATVAFTLTRSGGVTTVSLAGSSGAGVLDQAALAMVRRAQPFPAMPDGGPASMSFTAAIRYDLR